MKRALTFLKAHADVSLAGGLFVGYLLLLLVTAGSLGFMRDEGFYFAAARSYAEWFGLLFQDPAQALSPSIVDRYWSLNHEHPALMRSLFALSSQLLGSAFGDVSTSFRLPGMLLSSAAVALIFWWGQASLGRAGALVAAVSFAFIPPVFFHAHLACFDMPACAMWLIASYVYSRALALRTRGWLVAAGLVYGLFLDTKHNSWIFPFALLAHFLLTQSLPLWRELKSRGPWWRRLPLVWLSMAVLGPLVFYALWPWLWHDTVKRLHDYALFHTQHDYYNMEFLGQTYFRPPMPRGYAWLMTVATVPLVTLLLALIGALIAVAPRGLGAEPAPAAYRSDFALWGVSILMSYAPWLSTNTPIFGGTKHWLTAYPFLCLFAGLGFVTVRAAFARLVPKLASPWIAAACVLVGPLVMTLHSHPFGLSAYTPLVGGAPGAASLGLNRTFWGYTTQSLLPFVNQSASQRATVYMHDTAPQSFAMFQESGRLRADLRGSLNISVSDVALYHHEPHMSRVEHQIWMLFGSTSPDAIAAFDGVPIAWAYLRARPDAPAQPPRARP